jgi:hypothetical protein
MKKGVPISPNDIPAAILEIIPQFVFDAVNQLLVKKSNTNTEFITLYKNEIVDEITAMESSPFQEWWLNFEDAYRQVGWEVEYNGAGDIGKFWFQKVTK